MSTFAEMDELDWQIERLLWQRERIRVSLLRQLTQEREGEIIESATIQAPHGRFASGHVEKSGAGPEVLPMQRKEA